MSLNVLSRYQPNAPWCKRVWCMYIVLAVGIIGNHVAIFIFFFMRNRFRNGIEASCVALLFLMILLMLFDFICLLSRYSWCRIEVGWDLQIPLFFQIQAYLNSNVLQNVIDFYLKCRRKYWRCSIHLALPWIDPFSSLPTVIHYRCFFWTSGRPIGSLIKLSKTLLNRFVTFAVLVRCK